MTSYNTREGAVHWSFGDAVHWSFGMYENDFGGVHVVSRCCVTVDSIGRASGRAN